MVKVLLPRPTEREFAHILNTYNNNGILRGGSLEDIDIFRSPRRRRLRGAGFFDIISRIGKFMLPAVKNILIPTGANIASGVLKDVSKGKNIKQSLKKRTKQSLKQVGSRILHGKGVKKNKNKSRNTIFKRKKISRGGSSTSYIKCHKKKLKLKKRKNPRKFKIDDIFS